ncbi:MAG: DUF4091 domain-containing protein [Bacteroidales bacterium]|nr:DUF4091 domain-containing protein [Bacteroidales bacterium]
MKKIVRNCLVVTVFSLAANGLNAQDAEQTQAAQKVQAQQLIRREMVPVEQIEEMADPAVKDSAQWQNVKGTSLAWGTTARRYGKHEVPALKAGKALSATGWKGERIFLQAVLWGDKEITEVNLIASDLIGPKGIIPSSAVIPGFERFVMGDTYGNGSGWFHTDDVTTRDSVLVADPVIGPYMASIEGETVRPIWVEVKIPADAAPGLYKGSVMVACKELDKPLTLKYNLNVRNHTLAEPSEWSFHLDLWQNPSSIARYYNVTPWSPEHFEVMRPIMEHLAAAGEKVVTATILYDCWGPQTLDLFDSMVRVSRDIDGNWAYDYTIFDRWVEFMASCGIDAQINCFSIIPWQTRARYYDMATGTIEDYPFSVGDDNYFAFFKPMLADLAKHLKAKGWFEKTVIAMDERNEEQMRIAIDMAREIDPGYKIALAGNYHPTVESELYDLSVTFKGEQPYIEAGNTAINARRSAEGKFTTIYTCCGEDHPNTFSISPLVESASIGWYALAAGYDGYLRWAFNSWNQEPLRDSRWIRFTSGDAFLIYPQCRTSIRFDLLVEGIQAFEKVRALRREYADNPKALLRLEQTIAAFTNEALTAGRAEELVSRAKAALDVL